jgi:hypothetical protein
MRNRRLWNSWDIEFKFDYRTIARDIWIKIRVLWSMEMGGTGWYGMGIGPKRIGFWFGLLKGRGEDRC